MTRLNFIIHLPEIPCLFHQLTGLYCPLCGGTRSMKALFRGEILLALHENPVSPLLILTGFLFLPELLLKKSGMTVRLFPRNQKFWTSLMMLWLIWAVLRNFFPALQPAT